MRGCFSAGIALPMAGPFYTMVQIIQGDTNNEQKHFDHNNQSIGLRNSQLRQHRRFSTSSSSRCNAGASPGP
jgi:hypothetical protein